jgi:mannitol-1-/sugar-/sorbitol-6-/2-deoxyglucose-6-phosphatase
LFPHDQTPELSLTQNHGHSSNLFTYEAILFDMDGVLIDSEPFWREAQIEVYASLGKTYTEKDCAETMGIRIDQVVALRVPESDQKQVVADIVDRMIDLVTKKGKPLSGVLETLECVERLGIPCGLATSSSYRLLQATLRSLGLEDAFRIVHSAEEEEFGKPHPAVYLSAAKKLGFEPSRCLAIEDSVNGMISAKAAQMPVIVTPEEAIYEDCRFCLADLKVRRLDEAIPTLEKGFVGKVKR